MSRIRTALAGLLACGLAVSAASAEVSGSEAAVDAPAASETSKFFDALTGGKVKLDMRFRWENADFDGLKHSNAVTLRTRLGYGTLAYHGFSTYAEFENVVALKNRNYFDGVAPNSNGRSVIADPEATEVNQAFLQWSTDSLATGSALEKSKTSLLGGRTRIVLDDARFIGNVGWRQNEQTYDAGVLRSAFGVEGLATTYGYLFDVHRVFGDKGAPGAATRDFSSDSHIVNATYSGFEPLSVTVFGYWLDFKNSPANSSDTYGVRAAGKTDVGSSFVVSYAASYAYQKDNGRNPTDYATGYYNLEGGLGYAPWGGITVGCEVLGSDNAVAQFRTPLATAHMFNGWADAFLDNGAALGLSDLYVAIAPKLPWELTGRLVYHRFESENGNTDYGDEIDGVLSKQVFKNLSVLAKFAWYDGGSGPRPDRHRVWLETSLEF